MNIALFTDAYLPTKNGVVTVVNMLYESLKELGHHVVIVTCETKEKDPEIENNPDIFKVPSTKLGMGTVDQFMGFPIFTSVSKFLKKNHIQLIHVHTEFTIGMHAFHEARKLHIPIIATTHTMWEDYYKYYLPGGKIISVDVIRKAIHTFYKHFNCIVNVSSKARNYFKKDFIVPEMPSVVIPNALNPENYCAKESSREEIEALREKLGIKPDDTMFLFVGRVVEEKRVLELIDLLEPVLKSNKKYKAVFVGDGQIVKHCKMIAKSYGLEESYIFTGFIDWHEVHKYYEAGDIFMTASLSEMHSMTVLEALTSGLPVVVRYDESYIDTVVPGENGYLSESDEQMSKDLISLAEDKEKQKKYGEASKIKSKDYLPETFSKRYEAVYATVLKLWKSKGAITDEVLQKAIEDVKQTAFLSV